MAETTITLGGLVLHQPYEWIVTEIKGWYDSPALRTAYTAKAFAAGSYYSPGYQDVREIDITGRVAAADEATLIRRKRQLGGLCMDPTALYELQVNDAAGALFIRVQRSSDVTFTPLNPLAADYTFTVTAPDPRLLDTQLQSVTTQLAQPSGIGGIAWNGTGGSTGTEWNGPDGSTGLSLGQPGITGGVTVDNTTGTAPADLVFTIRGPVDTPSVSSTYGWLTYNGQLGSSDILVIDTGSGSVLLNGTNVRTLLTSAQWFQAPPQQAMAIRFSANDENSVATCTVTWRISYS